MEKWSTGDPKRQTEKETLLTLDIGRQVRLKQTILFKGLHSQEHPQPWMLEHS